MIVVAVAVGVVVAEASCGDDDVEENVEDRPLPRAAR